MNETTQPQTEEVKPVEVEGEEGEVTEEGDGDAEEKTGEVEQEGGGEDNSGKKKG